VTFAGISGGTLGINGNKLAASIGALQSSGGSAISGSAIAVDAILQRSGQLAAAAADLGEVPLPKGWIACLSQQQESRVCHAEHNGQLLTAFENNPLVAANHGLLQAGAAPAQSLARQAWLEKRLTRQAPADAGELLAALVELPAQGTLRLAAVVDS